MQPSILQKDAPQLEIAHAKKGMKCALHEHKVH